MRQFLLFLTITAISFAQTKTPLNEAGNDNLDIYATALLDKEQIRAAVGAELPPGTVVVQMKVVPRGEEPLSISRDDFTLISHNDGQRSGPFSPAQLVGNSTLTVSRVSRGGAYIGNPGGPIWGGAPGTTDRPRQIGGDQPVAGNASGSSETTATVKNDSKPENPLVAHLESKMLPDKLTKEPVSGLLYFPLEGKHKLKHLEIIYKGPGGRLVFGFK